MSKQITNELAEFIEQSPTAFHAVNTMAKMLDGAGFKHIREVDSWNIIPGEKYYVTRNNSSLIAFKVARDLSNYNFKVTASHSDSPTFKIKEMSEISVRDKYTKLNTEGYGGMICSTWLDRPLSIAGRVLVREDSRLVQKLLCFDRDLLMIPSLAIHMDRKQNEGHSFNKQIDMLPLIGGKDYSQGRLLELIAEELKLNKEDIISSDLYLYNRMKPTVWGADEEFFSAARLDDLQCAFSSLKGLVDSKESNGINVFACFDNEEVGSGTKQGAASTMLADVLKRINSSLGKSEEDYYRAVAGSFMISCDNAHAVHPNFPEKADQNNCAYINDGIVIKSHAGQKYTSDGVSIGIFKTICEKAEVPVQYFSNRSDAVGGSTLGNLAMSQVSLNAVDIGLPQLAMHSSYETCGVRDTEYMVKACTKFYESSINLPD